VLAVDSDHPAIRGAVIAFVTERSSADGVPGSSCWAIRAARDSAVGAVHRHSGTSIDASRGRLLRSARLLGGCKHPMRAYGDEQVDRGSGASALLSKRYAHP
jgi:hypothetical protein